MSIAILLLFLAIILAGRVQIAFALGITTLFYLVFFLPHVPLRTIPQQMYAGTESFSLTAIPFFVLVGEIMNAGGISRRLVGFARTVVGHFTGGMGIVALFSSMIFASFSGSAIANAAGTGSVTIPAMIRSGYSRGLAAAVESASSSLGAIIPPSIPMIVYGTIAGVSIGGLFIAGYLPGIILALAVALTVRYSALRMSIPRDKRESFRSVLAAAWSAAPALLTPIIIMGGIMGGVMTPTEAGAVGVVYALIVASCLYREPVIRRLPELLINTAVTTGVVMFVMSIASVFSWIMAFEGIPSMVAETVLNHITQPYVLMAAIVVLLIIIGTFIDTISALIILTPVIVPVADKAGIDPLFLGLIVTTSLTLGVCTPPVGVVLFVTSSIAKTKIEKTSLAIMPIIGLMILLTLIIALLPPSFILWLPRLFGF